MLRVHALLLVAVMGLDINLLAIGHPEVTSYK